MFKQLHLLLCSLLLLFAIGTNADVVTQKIGDITYSLDTEAKTAIILNDGSNRNLNVTTLHIPNSVVYQDVTYTVSGIEGTGNSLEGAFMQGLFTKVTFDSPVSYNSIPSAAFISCSKLKEITFPEGITTLDYHSSVGRCAELEKIELPSTTNIICDYSFRSDPKLSVVKFNSTQLPATLGNVIFAESTVLSNINIVMPDAAINTFLSSKFGTKYDWTNNYRTDISRNVIGGLMTATEYANNHFTRGARILAQPSHKGYLKDGDYIYIQAATGTICNPYFIKQADENTKWLAGATQDAVWKLEATGNNATNNSKSTPAFRLKNVKSGKYMSGYTSEMYISMTENVDEAAEFGFFALANSPWTNESYSKYDANYTDGWDENSVCIYDHTNGKYLKNNYKFCKEHFNVSDVSTHSWQWNIYKADNSAIEELNQIKTQNEYLYINDENIRTAFATAYSATETIGATSESIAQAKATLLEAIASEAQSTVIPADGTYFKLRSAANDWTIGANGDKNGPVKNTAAPTDGSDIWQFVGTGTVGQYYLYNPYAQKYLGKTGAVGDNTNIGWVVGKGTAGQYKVIPGSINGINGVYLRDVTSDNDNNQRNGLHSTGSVTLVHWWSYENENSLWQFDKVADEDLALLGTPDLKPLPTMWSNHPTYNYNQVEWTAFSPTLKTILSTPCYHDVMSFNIEGTDNVPVSILTKWAGGGGKRYDIYGIELIKDEDIVYADYHYQIAGGSTDSKSRFASVAPGEYTVRVWSAQRGADGNAIDSHIKIIPTVNGTAAAEPLEEWTKDDWTDGVFADMADELKNVYVMNPGTMRPSGYKYYQTEICLSQAVENLQTTFEYMAGNNQLEIQGVEILSASGGDLISCDIHYGKTGNNDSNNKYNLSIPKANTPYIFRIWVSGTQDAIGRITHTAATGTTVTPTAQPLRSGVYEIKNYSGEGWKNRGGRGYIVNSTQYAAGPSIADCEWDSYKDRHFKTHDDADNFCKLWYVYKKNDTDYLIFSLGKFNDQTKAQFLKVPASGKCTWSEDPADDATAVKFDERSNKLAPNSDGLTANSLMIKPATQNATSGNIYLNNACGTFSTSGAFGASNNSDGGTPFAFIPYTGELSDSEAAMLEMGIIQIENPAPNWDALASAISAAEVYPLGEDLGQYNAEGYIPALDAAKEMNTAQTASAIEVMQAIQSIATSKLSINTPTPGSFLIIKGKTGGKYMNGRTLSSDPTVMWYGEDNKLVTYSTGLGFKNTSEDATVNDEFNTQTFAEAQTQGTYFIISNASGVGQYMYENTNNVDRYSDAAHDRKRWNVSYATSIPVTISDAGLATLYSPVALEIPANVKAYGSTETADGVIKFEEITGIIPAKTGVIIEGEPNTYDFNITTGGTGSSTLVGTATTTATVANAYTLQKKNNVLGFYKYSGETLKGFKSYLTLGSGSNGFVIALPGDELTGMNDATTAAQAGTYVDLLGHKVSNPQKGQIYILNGKLIKY